MNMLVMGGTKFVSRAVVLEALARGHTVTCACRGVSGRPPDGARWLPVDRDTPGGLEPLDGQHFDAAVDTALLSVGWVRDVVATVSAGHWSFVSSTAVYSDSFTPGQRAATAAVVDPVDDDGPSTVPDVAGPREQDEILARYAGVKVASEQVLRGATGDRALIVRPGLIVGPGDQDGVFGWWPVRMARGGRVVVPADDPAADWRLPAQLIDVRDLAAFILDGAEQRLAGTFDAVAPSRPLSRLLEGIADAVGPADLELAPVPEEVLRRAGVRPWDGPRSLPLWPPLDLYGAMARDVTDTLEAGLRIRPFRDTCIATLEDEMCRQYARNITVGLTQDDEADILASVA